ncbi:hypothetical protein ABB37_08776 [Leptomonas pyrrhocoris]|uniref:DNA repair protein Rad9 n=1 Tax=Leptomonas pyrrhocoris TaxID=157538 RepID=A0A0M9FSR7_LEPPY|nr:hypothetical protein ABB37_08776 [Leptomonas pyrrhocoris]XP_015653545.1 hypothetical protein ABB37_08776 [Leptomonas pyrrhocoris]KPA75105.1 hypothetical protein ABB37_08776 [Leptomonas pyrrhocoris]KPA75106.1 hypothetical protein ABB37_08776 [Leptomonas pyrrhocoris]|eukprot:XP_015653544.1 hypothetical protein ABB37_08776 [Leptomonas pyrrhocoris]
MSLHFTVSGGNVRTFLSVLLCVGKIGEAVYFVALHDGIEVSAVTPSLNGHIAVRIHACYFDNYAFQPLQASSATNADGMAADGGRAEGGDVPTELFLCVLAKTLMATVLRQHSNGNLQSIEFCYDVAESMQRSNSANRSATEAAAGGEGGSGVTAVPHEKRDSRSSSNNNTRPTDFDERIDADMVRWTCTYARNMSKTFLLRLAEGVPTSVCADARRYHFETCGEARSYGSLLASLPSSAGQCGLTLLESGVLELRSVNNTQPQQSTASTTRGKAASGMTASSADGSAAVVTAFAKAFHLFRFYDVVRASASLDTSSSSHDNTASSAAAAAATPASQQVRQQSVADDLGTSSGPSMVPPTPSPSTQQQQPSSEMDKNNAMASAESEAEKLIRRPFVQLPGKVFDVKPFKLAALLAEQLGVQLRLRCGEAGMPLILTSITPEELQELIAADSATGQASRSTGTGPMRGSNRHDSEVAYRSGVVAAPALHRSARPTAVSACISFVMHVAALDMASAVTDAGAATEGGQSTSIATATSSTVNTPRASAHHPSLPPFSPIAATAAAQRHSGGGGGEEKNLDIHRGRAGADGVNSFLPPSFSPSTSALASATRSSTHFALGGGGGDLASVASSVVQPSPQEDERQPFTSSDHVSSSCTPSHVEASFASAALSPLHFGRTGESLPEGEDEVKGGLDATPRPSVASTSDVVMVMTGEDTPENHGSSGSGNQHHPTAAVANTAASLNSLYPLDFEAFARSYATQNGADDEEEDAQDAELREFLASCVASMSRGPTQN